MKWSAWNSWWFYRNHFTPLWHSALTKKTENQMTVKIKVIIYKLCGELFLWNNIWDLEIEIAKVYYYLVILIFSKAKHIQD